MDLLTGEFGISDKCLIISTDEGLEIHATQHIKRISLRKQRNADSYEMEVISGTERLTYSPLSEESVLKIIRHWKK